MENNQPRKSYYAIIPADVRYSPGIVDGAKLLYGEVTALCNERGYCWATNDYFAKLYKCEARTISRWIASLLKESFIYIDSSKGQRKIFLAHKFDPAEVYETEVAPERTETEGEIKTAKKKKPKPEKKAIEKKYTDDDLFLAEMLLQKIIYNFPTFENKKVNIGEWADDIRKLREIDKATRQQIYFMITWLQGGEVVSEGKPPRKFEPHDFWSKNILSARKMRKQWFENLVPQLQDSVKKIVKKSTVTQL